MINEILDFLDWNDGLGLNTRTESVDKPTIRAIVKETVRYCTETFGVNNRRGKEFKVSIRKQTSGDAFYGEYDYLNNTLIIYHNNCGRIKDLVKTTIHEYTHYMQPVRTSYHKLLERYGYEKHPMEIEARENENYYYRKAWKQLKQTI
jgi:hypothetical protein